MLGVALAAAAEPRGAYPPRRLEQLSESAFVAWLESRPRGRSGGALVVLRPRQPDEAALDALASATARAVRPGDRVGRAGAVAVAIWLDGLPPMLAEPRAERLRLSLHRQGICDIDLATLAVAADDGRDAAALLAEAAERLGSLEHVPS